MKRHGLIALIVVLLTNVAAQAQPFDDRYPNGTSGIKGGSMPTDPGWYWLAYNYNYVANQLVDGNGRPAVNGAGQPLDFKTDIFASAHRFVQVTDYKIFGATFGWDFVVPIVNNDLTISGIYARDTALAIGDLNVEPFVIEWHKPRYDFGFVYGFFAPTGPYNPGRPAYAGAGYWTNYVGPAGTYYFDDEKKWAASFLSRYEFNGRQDFTNVTPGQVFSFEWGLSRNIAKVFDFGISGYCSWQTTHDTGTYEANQQPLSRSFAIGPEIQYFAIKDKMGFHLRHEFEFDVRNRTEGQITTLTFTFAF